MSVAAIGQSVPLVGSAGKPTTSQSQKPSDGRPNTGMFNSIFRGIPNTPEKLPTSRIPAIVSRMQRDTKATSAKKSRWYKSENYVDPRTYSWKNLALFSDYQAHMWTESGGIKSSFKK